MTTSTETQRTATAIASGIAYVRTEQTAQEFLWLFGKDLQILLKGTKNRDGVKLAIATTIAGKCNLTVKTMQNKITLAIKCKDEFDSRASARSWALEEKNKKAKAMTNTLYTKRVRAMAPTFNQLTDAEVNALVQDRKALLKASK